MLTSEMTQLLAASKEVGWVIEPEAKRLFMLAGLDTTTYTWTDSLDEVLNFGRTQGYPLVAKVVSPRIIHKSEVAGVVTGIEDADGLSGAFGHLMSINGAIGVIVEKAVKGLELIIGAKVDEQFGPVILLGAGGTAVEIYNDVAIRMAPLAESDVTSMISSLKAHKLLEGYRGIEPINMKSLTTLLVRFSHLVMELQGIVDSIDLNPVICSSTQCIIADARIMLTSSF